jgi:hypothetical protein
VNLLEKKQNLAISEGVEGSSRSQELKDTDRGMKVQLLLTNRLDRRSTKLSNKLIHQNVNLDS